MDKEYTITVVHQSLIDIIWDQVGPIVDRVVEKAPLDMSTEKVKERLVSGEDALMAVYDGVTIIGIVVLTVRVLDAGTRVLLLPVVGGDDIDNWMDKGFKLIFGIAKQYNCTELRGLSARKGWLRKMSNYGWEEVFTTVRLPIGE